MSEQCNAALNSIARRMRLKNYQFPKSEPLNKISAPLDEMEVQIDGTEVEALECQKRLLLAMGGLSQQERMIYDKRRSLDRALLYSYQGANIIKITEKKEGYLEYKPTRALINPNKLKQDYDDKIISVPYEYNLNAGDVFEWLGTNTYWLIYLQDLTELAYFRGDIRKCSYEIFWKDENGEHNTYAAIRGPVETKIDYLQKHSISIDRPNYSLNILMPKNENTLSYFKRYSKFYLKNDIGVCWRVEAIDWISTPGILEVNAVEYYGNEQEDDNDIVGNLIVKKKNPNSVIENAAILGETFIKPKLVYHYVTANKENSNWSIKTKCPVQLIVDENDPKKCSIKWTRSISGQFELSYGKYSKTIIVESLF